MSNISCEIIKDMLPLYYDKVCSGASEKMVEEHLAQCSSCRSELDKMKIDINIPEKIIENNCNDGNKIKYIADCWKRSKQKAFLKGLIGASVVCLIIFLGYGVFNWNIISVPTDVIEITDVCRLGDGRIVYHSKITDGYQLRRCKYEMDKEGNFYVIPCRPIIKTKSIGLGFEDTYDDLGGVQNSAYHSKYGDDAEIKALYYGSIKDNILVWKKGMNLPEASGKVEEMFRRIN